MTAINLISRIRPDQRIEVYKARTEERVFFDLAGEFQRTVLEKYLFYSVTDIYTLTSEDTIFIEIDWRYIQ